MRRTHLALTLLLALLHHQIGAPEALEEPAEQPPDGGALDIEQLTPGDASFFAPKDAIDRQGFAQIDCHLRNLDFCFAGLLGTMNRALPESDRELEFRCDEMRAAMSCLAVFNDRCQTFRVFAALSPFASYERLTSGDNSITAIAAAGNPELGEQAEQLLMNSERTNQTEPLRAGDLLGLCEPQQRQSPVNRRLRARLFQLAKCVNAKIPSLRPCIEDLKTALQIYYEPARVLPMKPSCCAISRFRLCAVRALDNVCGLSSFEQLEQTLATGAGSVMKSLERVCRQESTRPDSAYCQEVLPPTGSKAPVQRRGQKASKLARALDLISFAPAAQ